VRCDRHRPTCSRCAARGVACLYVTSNPRQRAQQQFPISPNRRSLSSSSLEHDRTDFGLTSANSSASILATGHVDTQTGGLSSSIQVDHNLATGASDLVPVFTSETVVASLRQQSENETTDEVHISPQVNDRPAKPPGNETPSRDLEVDAHSPQSPSRQCLSFLSRIFRTYPRMMSRREQLPPFIHESQVSSTSITAPLANCFALSQMWESSNSGFSSRDFVESSIRREMEKVFDEVSRERRPLAE